MKYQKNIFAIWLALIVLGALGTVTQARAGTVASSPTAPVVNDNDIANYGGVTGSDKWWIGTYAGELTAVSAKGQTFLTGDGIVRLKSITYQTATATQPSKDLTVRVGTVSGNSFTVVHSETMTQSTAWPAGSYVTWTFATPILLNGSTTYGVDVHMDSSTISWNVAGIPYLNVTANEYTLGASYTSGTNGNGNGDGTIKPTSSDRIFHLDIEPPFDGGFNFVGGNPPDDDPAAIIRPELVGTFSQNLLSVAGNLTIRNLTDTIDTVISVGDPGVVITNNLLKISTAGRIVAGKNYAIRIDPGALLDQNSNAFQGINDDTTWNFTTGGDPLLLAVAALKGHINGIAPLNAAQIEAHKLTIDQNLNRFPESVATITNVCDLVRTYETVLGPLWVSRSLPSRAFVSNTNIHWAIYGVMQNILDTVYNPATLAAHEGLLNGFKFNSSSNFPGACAPPASPTNVHTAIISADYLNTRGPATQGDGPGTYARKPTGTYLAPGTMATVTVPAALINKGYKIRIGAHSWDFSNRPNIPRLDRSTVVYNITSTNTKVANPLGGGIYIEVPFLASNGIVNVDITGAVRSPYFSAKSFHTTTPAQWLIERTNAAPWADFQSEKFMMQVPRSWIYAMPDPSQLMTNCDLSMDAMNDLMGYPRVRGKETMYPQVDLQLRAAVYAPGYPSVNNSYSPTTDYGGYLDNYLVRGPQYAPDYYFHEQGHSYFFPKFGGESESAVNLLHVAVWNQKLGFSMDEAFRTSRGETRPYMTLDTAAIAWMCSFNFSPRDLPMDQGEKKYQLKGHAKFVDIAQLYGWGVLSNFWGSMVTDVENSNPIPATDDDKLLRLSQAVGKDVRPLFHFWGIHPQNPEALATAIANAGIPADTNILNRLNYYKTIVPTNNDAFRHFATNWWGRKPLITGFWEETDHAMQWDEVEDFDPGGSTVRPNGDIYVEASAADIIDRIQEIALLYFPGPITPNPMCFAVLPSGVSATAIGMVATNATAAIGPVEYYFENVTNGNFRTWGTNTVWNDTGLTTGEVYGYRIKARDGASNVTDWSAVAVAVAAADVTAPLPNPMRFVSVPRATNESSITMTAATALDASGVEYYFENLTGPGHSSGWQDSPVYTDTSLPAQTAYTYRVRARDKSLAQNTTTNSASFAATTDITSPTPDPMTWATPPTALSSRWITMTATAASDPAGVEYYFENLTILGHDSGWQSSSTYIDTGLTPNTEYTYQVKARDKSSNANETGDSATASATTQDSTVTEILAWDANNLNSGQADGAGEWTAVNQWWNGTANTNWNSGADAEFGNGGAGGAVTLATNTTVNSLTMNSSSGTYTLGSEGQTITINSGILRTAGAGTANIISPVTLGTNQTWMNYSSNPLNVAGVVGDGGNGNGLTVSGPGTLVLSNANTYTGTTIVAGGVLRLGNAAALPGGIDASGGTSALILNGGVVELGNGNFQRNLGAGSDQFQVPGGASGFSANGSARVVTVNNDANVELVWGSANFNPSSLVLNQTTANNTLTMANKIDLAGAARTIEVNANTATLIGDIQSSSGTGGLIKNGAGTLAITNAANNANTYNGGTVVNAGNFTISADSNLGDTSGGLTFNGTNTFTSGNISLHTNRPVAVNTGAKVTFANFVTINGPFSGGGTIIPSSSQGSYLKFLNPSNSFTGLVYISSQANVEVASLGDAPGVEVIRPNASGSSVFTYSASAIAPLTLNYRQFELNTPNNRYGQYPETYGLKISNNGPNPPANTRLTINTDLGSSFIGAEKLLMLGGSNTDTNLFAGKIVDAMGLTRVVKSDSGIWGLSGTNTYAGVTKINAGTLIVNNVANGGSPSSLGQSSSSPGNLILNGGTLKYAQLNNTSGTPSGGGSASTDRNFTLIGNNAIDASGTAALVLNAPAGNVLSPDVTSLSFTATGSDKILTNLPSTALLWPGMSVSGPGIAAGSTISQVNSATHITLTSSANVTSTSGTADFGFAARTLTLTGTSTNANTIAGTLVDSTATGSQALSLTKSGAGTWVLSGQNTYTGSTTVNAGTLFINGNSAVATNRVTVANGATLGGFGVIGGSVTNLAGTTLAPGDANGNAGKLTLANGLGLNGANLVFTLTNASPGAYSQLFITNGSLVANGVNAIKLIAATNLIPDGTYVLITNAVARTPVAGQFVFPQTRSTIWTIGGAILTLINGTNSVVLTVSGGPVAVTNSAVAEIFTWDKDGLVPGQTDGAGAWLGTNLWWNGSANTNWVSGYDAAFGNGGTGGAVTLASVTTINTLTMGYYSGTYTLGSAGQTITLSNGIAKTAISGGLTFVSPLVLAAPQTWANLSSSALVTGNGNNLVDNNGYQLIIDGSGNTTFGAMNDTPSLTGSGNLIKNGTGTLALGGTNSNFTGNVTVNGGVLRVAKPASINGNLNLAGGVYEHYWSDPYTRTFGTNAGQIQITGGISGFSENGNTGVTFTFNNSAAFELVWGTNIFNPSTFVLQADTAQGNSSLTLANKINLNGANRTIQVSGGTTGGASATLSGAITNSTGTAGLIKTGAGRLNLNAANTYNGGTTLQAGTLQLGNNSALGSTNGVLTVNAGLLNLNNFTVTVGNLTGTNGTIVNNGNAAQTLTIGAGNATGGIYQGVIANNTNAGTGTVSLTKTGTGTITLAGTNTYTGPTTNNAGTLLVNGSITSAVINKSGATFGGTGSVTGDVDFGSASFALFTNGAAMLISGNLTLNNNTVKVNLDNNVPAGTYTLASYTGSSSGDVNPAFVTNNSGSLAFGATGYVTNDTTAQAIQLLVVVGGGPSTPGNFSGISVTGTTLNLTVTNGTPNGVWTLLESTNLLVPIAQWPTNRTGNYDGSGNLTTNIVDTATNPAAFFLLK